MSAAHAGLAVLVAVLWGLAFVATKIALDSFSPPALAAVRFLIAALPACVLARPPIPWGSLIAVGLFLFTGQFLFQFFGIARGMPAGLAAIVVQTQALFTIVLAALVLRERPTARHVSGTAVAFAGLVLIAGTVGEDLSPLGLALTMLSAISWAIGNVLLKRLPPVEPLNLAVWLSLVPPLPALAIALATEGLDGLIRSVGSSVMARPRRRPLSGAGRHRDRLRRLGLPAAPLPRRRRHAVRAPRPLRGGGGRGADAR